MSAAPSAAAAAAVRRAAPAVSAELRFELADLYAEYAACLDEGRFEEWPDFFTEDCTYKIVPRENFDRGLPLCTVWAESRGMLQDRVVGITQTMMYQPHYWRHLVGPLRIREAGGGDGAIGMEANYAVFRTMPDEPSEVFQVGRYLDRIAREDGRLKFREKLCVFDTLTIKNSLIYPI
ncbi:MAG TPA: aromatic-ring-hydroxylating dioxygenase subunit beta [Stellaceae bacterium]|jgi:salicylate 5-hydroxylase small subunit